MKRVFFAIMLAMAIMIMGLAGCEAEPEAEEEVTEMTLATTTSTYDSGLLHEILPEFEEEHNTRVDIISVGTGQAITTGKRGDCDIILVHARELEEQFVEDGYGTERYDVMYNDFVIVGPEGDPGDVYDSADINEAIDNIVEHTSAEDVPFLSRGDNSGTHAKEMNLWELVGYDQVTEEEWHDSMGQGMGDTLVATNERQGYALADRGTFLSMEDELPNLEIVFEEDEELANPYGIIPVNPEEHPHVKHEEAQLMIDFFTSEETQEKIGEFGIDEYGEPLFFPDA